MLNMDLIIKVVVVSAMIILCCGINYYWPTSSTGAEVEKVAEEVIQKESGVSVDFSPPSDDKK